MNILHINSQDSGGAFQAAYRLHEGLIEQDINSNFLVLYKNKDQNQVHQFLKNRNTPVKQLNQAIKYRLLSLKHNNALKDKPQAQFSFAKTAFRIQNHPLIKQADIINLHWVSNFLDYYSFFSKINKPVIWTLHDMNPFSGGFHYKMYEVPAYAQLNQKILQKKKQSLEKAQDLQIVAPSKWLFNLSKQSDLLKKFPHHHIPYGLNTEIFKPISKNQARNLLGLPLDAKIVLFVAESLNDQRKGVAYLLEALKHLEDFQLYLTLLGSGKTNEWHHSHKLMGFVEDPVQMANIYAAADVFVIPSQEDNLPNTVLESLACGTPVVGFDIGGIPDMIKPGINGFITKPFDTLELAQNIKTILSDDDLAQKMRQNARKNATQFFNLSLQAKQYIDLYRRALN